MAKSTSKLNRTLLVLLLVVTAPLWLALVMVAVLAHAVREVALYLIVWFWWIVTIAGVLSSSTQTAQIGENTSTV
jgi:hypothetical protein